MSSASGPRKTAPGPRLVPAPAGTKKSACKADNTPRSPQSPQIRDDTYTYGKRPVGSIERDA